MCLLKKSRYFAVPYSLPKLDMIAIPDFAAGAMENYGLVTYRETALLYDEKHSAAANKQRVRHVFRKLLSVLGSSYLDPLFLSIFLI